VRREEWLEPSGTGEELHISTAAWADLLLLAPATAHLLARLSIGLADDFLTTTALAFTGPVVAAPAMHAAMWAHPATRDHVATLTRRGVRFVGPVEGPLASGEVGMGRMAEVADLVAAVEGTFARGDLVGRTLLVTAGPTHEAIDPVRYLANRSSGKMGFAIAAEAARRGARVILVAGPVALTTPTGVERVDVISALEMADAVRRLAPGCDIVVMAAAVADFRPERAATAKLKKDAGPPALSLVANPDILALLPECAPHALRVGFAAESGELEREARRKLAQKGAHLLVANDIARADIGFASDANEVTVYGGADAPLFLSRRPKDELAHALVDLFARELARLSREPETVAR